MSDYIYLYCDRIIYSVPQTAFYKPVGNILGMRWYLVHAAPSVPYATMIQQGNYGFNLHKGFVTVDDEPPMNWNDRGDIVKQIQILERYNSLANTQKMKYTNNSVGQALIDILTLEEIREYRQTGSIENCTILTSLAETTEKTLTPEALAMKLWLQYESYRKVIAYLNKLEFKVRELLENKQFDQASQVVNDELEKMRM